MKFFKLSILVISTILANQNLFAAAKCIAGEASVRINDNATITVMGLEGVGIKSSTYSCSVYNVSQTWVSSESRAICNDKEHNSIRLWQSEVIGFWGIRSASAAIYDGQGAEKFFEAPCVRD